jgi:hypothetical protein
MARAKSKRTGKRSSGGASRRRARPAAPASRDAIALLKADHRQVEEWFEQFEKTRSDERKQQLASQICKALEVHTKIEEELFYPAFLQATEEEDLHHEAAIEHDGAKKLIAEIEGSGPGDEYYDARVKVLSEMIKHHVNEEEKRDGMFAKARQSEMDLEQLGEQLAARKAQLEGGGAEDDDTDTSRAGAVRGGSRSRERGGILQRMRGR